MMRNQRRLARRRILLGATGLAAATALGGTAAFRALASRHGLATRTRAGLAFGTVAALTVAGPDEPVLEAALCDGFSAIRAVEDAASLLRPDSALSRLNREGHLDAPPADLTAMLGFALDLAMRTGGAFDPTVQPLWPLWSEASARGEKPDAAALRAVLARINWRRVRLTPERIAMEPGTALTLNALTQGHAADRVMAALRVRGIEDAFVDTGEFGAQGTHADGTPWRLGIADPHRTETLANVLAPFTGFAATSGDYRMCFSADRADHHIFDPATGRSPRDLSSVTVIAGNGLLADGLSTACMVLGEARGRDLMAGFPGCTTHFTGKA